MHRSSRKEEKLGKAKKREGGRRKKSRISEGNRVLHINIRLFKQFKRFPYDERVEDGWAAGPTRVEEIQREKEAGDGAGREKGARVLIFKKIGIGLALLSFEKGEQKVLGKGERSRAEGSEGWQREKRS